MIEIFFKETEDFFTKKGGVKMAAKLEWLSNSEVVE